MRAQARGRLGRNLAHLKGEVGYSKTCVKWPLKNGQNKDLKVKINGSLMKVKNIAECSKGNILQCF